MTVAGVSSEVVRPAALHRHASARPSRRARERQPGPLHRQRPQRGLPGTRDVDRGGRHGHAVRIAGRRRHHRDRRRRRRHRHGVVAAVRRQRRCDRRVLRAAPRRGRDRRAGAAPRRARSPPRPRLRGRARERRLGRRGRARRVRHARACSSRGTVTESTRYSFVVWGFNRAACANTEVAGIVVRPAPGAIGRCRADGLDQRGDVGPLRRRRRVGCAPPGDRRRRRQRRAARPAGEFGGSGWLRTLLNRPFGETARFQVRSCSVWGSCGPWSEVLPPSEPVADVRAAEPGVERRVEDLVLDRRPGQLRPPRVVPLRRRRRAQRTDRADRHELPGPRRQGRRPGLVGC